MIEEIDGGERRACGGFSGKARNGLEKPIVQSSEFSGTALKVGFHSAICGFLEKGKPVQVFLRIFDWKCLALASEDGGLLGVRRGGQEVPGTPDRAALVSTSAATPPRNCPALFDVPQRHPPAASAHASPPYDACTFCHSRRRHSLNTYCTFVARRRYIFRGRVYLSFFFSFPFFFFSFSFIFQVPAFSTRRKK